MMAETSSGVMNKALAHVSRLEFDSIQLVNCLY